MTTTQPKITFILPSLNGGGAEFVTRTWATALGADKVDVEVLLLRAEDDEPELAGVQVIVGARKSAGRVKEMRALFGHLKKSRGRVVIAMMTRANLQLMVFAVMNRDRHRFVVSERNIQVREENHTTLHIVVRDLIMKYLYRRADVFVAISHPVAAYFLGKCHLHRDRIWVVQNPALSKVQTVRTVRPEHDRSAITLVVPARIVETKRPHLALDVAAAIEDEFGSVSVEFFGDGPMRAEIESRPGVTVHGWVNDWFNHVPDNAVVLLPSVVEGFANVLVEAAARGIPSVVGSGALGSADALIPGVTGFFARGDDLAAYVDAVRQASRITAEFPRNWLEHFSADESLRSLLSAVAPGEGRLEARVHGD